MKKYPLYIAAFLYMLLFLSCGRNPEPDMVLDLKQFEYDYYLSNQLEDEIRIEYCFDSGTVIKHNIAPGEQYHNKVRIVCESGYIIEGEKAYINSDSFKIIFSDNSEICYYRPAEGVYDINLYQEAVLEDDNEVLHMAFKFIIDKDIYESAIDYP